jgi:hypothetical protein
MYRQGFRKLRQLVQKLLSDKATRSVGYYKSFLPHTSNRSGQKIVKILRIFTQSFLHANTYYIDADQKSYTHAVPANT